MFNSFAPRVVFQEVPNEVSLAFLITGCPFKCEGCHSEDSWSNTAGSALCHTKFKNYINQYQGLITCVLFFGGEWQSEQLIDHLKFAKQQGLKTCLYSGADKVSQKISKHLTFLKTGRWNKQLGGLKNKNTNQRFINVKTKITLNHQFLGN
ncbi:anaerobic ribonucleoside-triphosphate reductase activating protein [Pseudoalteromonas denitrificans]|nr:anaerobic ribonucleoside-triphosphate reductase activating protein [Pseudoalteromonas denitrificans]